MSPTSTYHQHHNWSDLFSRTTVEVFEKVENSLSRLLDEQEISDLNFKDISTELNQKEQALAKLEESRNILKNDLDQVDTELAEKRFHLSKYSTNNQLYQFRVTFILSSGNWSHCTGMRVAGKSSRKEPEVRKFLLKLESFAEV